jgi:hypothetical protein
MVVKGNSWVAEGLAAFQEGLNSTEWVSELVSQQSDEYWDNDLLGHNAIVS